MKISPPKVPSFVSGLGLALLLVVFLGPLLPACSSLPKGEVQRAVLSLEKNAPVRNLGLSTGELTLTSGERLPFTYLFAPRTTPPDGPRPAPVVFVHGTPSTLTTWVEPIFGGEDFAGMREERDCYAIEVIGHGMAQAAPGDYDFERCADFLGAAIRSLELDRVHLVGSSYGGEFAWRTALDEPDLVRSLTLIDSSGYPRRDQDWLPEEIKMRDYGLADWGWLLNSKARVEHALAPHFNEVPPERVDEFYLVCDNRENWRAMIDLVRDETGGRSREVENVEAPTLLLWGDRDLAYPADYYAERFLLDLPRAELVVLPDTGHYPHEERPKAVIGLLSEHFARYDR